MGLISLHSVSLCCVDYWVAVVTAFFSDASWRPLMKQPLVVYICNALDESVRERRQITTDSPAATNKVRGLANAMRDAQLHCIVLSLGRGRQNGGGSWHPAEIRRVGRTLFVYCGFLHLPLLTHLISALSVAYIVVKIAWRQSNLTVLSYNRSYHYILALIAARLLKVRSFLDLEDGYNNEGESLCGRLKNTIMGKAFGWLCPDGAMVANFGLSKQLACPPILACYGVAEDIGEPSQDWQSEQMQILFGGTLIEEVGCGLLISAVDILRHQKPNLVKKLRFVVTGKGPCADDFRALSIRAPEWVTFLESLPSIEYKKILHASHIGLSLRLAAYEMSNTTFPSKIVEYAQHGLLVVSTRTSDVPLLFGETALYLNEETASALADFLGSLVESREKLSVIALEGRKKILRACSPLKIGLDMKAMLTSDGYSG